MAQESESRTSSARRTGLIGDTSVERSKWTWRCAVNISRHSLALALCGTAVRRDNSCVMP
jgi:hypothetical protein